jgi:hypothetical protein
MNPEKIAQELVLLSKELVSSDLYDIEAIVKYLQREYVGRKQVTIKGNDHHLSISISYISPKNKTVIVNYSVVEDRIGNFNITGTETIKTNENLEHFKKIRHTIKSDDKDSYIPKMTQKKLRYFNQMYINAWLGL